MGTAKKRIGRGKRRRSGKRRRAIAPETSGGLGGKEQPPTTPGTIRDTRLEAKAIAQRWPIKPETRAAVIDRMAKIVTSPEASRREATAAAKALITAESQNQADEIAAKPQQHQHAHLHAFLDDAIEREIERITGQPVTGGLEGMDAEGEREIS